MSNPIKVRVDAPTATITLDRPEKRNALTFDMIQAVREALRDIYQEKRVRAIVLTGSGAAFCGGRDVPEMLEPSDNETADLQRWGDQAEAYRELIEEMLRLPKPIIAAVNGAAVGAGAGLVLASDIVIGCPQARFGLPDTRLGVVAGVEAPLLAFRLGAGAAARLLLTGAVIEPEEALQLGVYHEAVPGDLVWARAVEIGAQCAAAAPEAVLITKRLLSDTVGEQLLVQLSSGAIAAASALTTEAAQEGLKAFVEKRAPAWK
ncbi:MAG: enoyl-CoA hydratase/isomerase family protein [Planctomycetales bacterium]|nr:enoyl-CoA hydratase/isomerase family protein [Planctomycetales bacterium]